jgi:hypothetical protein
VIYTAAVAENFIGPPRTVLAPARVWAVLAYRPSRGGDRAAVRPTLLVMDGSFTANLGGNPLIDSKIAGRKRLNTRCKVNLVILS